MREAFLGQSAWAIVTSTEAVGLISFISAPSESIVEIGFGVGERRRGRGYASAAVRAVAALARDAGLSCLTAETASDNHASQRVLERNGFVRGAEREDPVDGHLIGWSLDLKGME